MRAILLLVILQHLLTVQSEHDYEKEFVNMFDPPTLPPAPTTLKYVFAISRSGIRAPQFTPYPQHYASYGFSNYWGVERGELTVLGEILMMNLGISLHSRYKDFFKSLTTKIVTAADSKRTIRSAQLVARWLFGRGTTITSSDTDYMDKYQLFSKEDPMTCPQFSRLRQDTMDELKQRNPYREDLQFITGIEKQLSYLDVMEIYDTLDMQKANFRYMSPQLSRIHWKQSHHIYNIFFVTGFNQQYLGYTAGPLFHEMFKAFDSCGVKCRGFHLHMTHSLILQSALVATSLSTFKPLVGTTLLIELHEGNKIMILLYQPLSWEDHGVLLEANNGNWLVVAMKNLCGLNKAAIVPYPVSCPLVKFRSKIPDWCPDKWSRKCNGEE